jgi:hypothetical protein
MKGKYHKKLGRISHPINWCLFRKESHKRGAHSARGGQLRSEGARSSRSVFKVFSKDGNQLVFQSAV